MSKINKVKKGLNIPILGSPKQKVDSSPSSKINSVGLIGKNYRGMKPTLMVEEGDVVKIGQKLFEDKKNPGVFYTASASGKVKSINRGEKRSFLSLIIEVDGKDDVFYSKIESPNNLNTEKIKEILLDTGLWTYIRVRPFAKVANPNDNPHSIFVNVMDTQPLAPNPEIIINLHQNEFQVGLQILSKLTEGKVNLCKHPSANIPHGESGKVINHFFDGSHPAGLVGYHIHCIDPVININKKVWYLGYQDVIAIGQLFSTGNFPTHRYVSLAGPQVENPRILKTRIGANLFDLTKGELKEAENRIISGSVLSGNQADDLVGFLGLYDNIVSVVAEDRKRVFHGFLAPGFDKFSVKNTFVSKIFPLKKFAFGTSLNGSRRDVVPIGSYEQVMPYDMISTFLVRALLSKDLELAEKLGALELDDEDVSLCTFVCPGKNDIGKALVEVLELIDKENQ